MYHHQTLQEIKHEYLKKIDGTIYMIIDVLQTMAVNITALVSEWLGQYP